MLKKSKRILPYIDQKTKASLQKDDNKGLFSGSSQDSNQVKLRLDASCTRRTLSALRI